MEVLEHLEEELVHDLSCVRVAQMIALHAQVSCGARAKLLSLLMSFKYFVKLCLLFFVIRQPNPETTLWVTLAFNELFRVDKNLVKRMV
jgi:hypothetical protein